MSCAANDSAANVNWSMSLRAGEGESVRDANGPLTDCGTEGIVDAAASTVVEDDEFCRDSAGGCSGAACIGMIVVCADVDADEAFVRFFEGAADDA